MLDSPIKRKPDAAVAYPEPCSHDPIQPLADDVFIVRGGIRLNPLVRISRNMTILRHDGELTLVNPIRLTSEGDTALRALGTVRRIVRLGALHGVDDPWYVEQFGAELWAQPGGTQYTTPPIARTLGATSPLPLPDVTLFEFRGTRQPEAALLVPGGLLLTCDAVQHYGDYSQNNWLARRLMPFIGFPRTTLIGPIWLKLMTPDNQSLRSEFERLLALPFDALFAAHGTLLATGAKAALEAAVAKAFGSTA